MANAHFTIQYPGSTSYGANRPPSGGNCPPSKVDVKRSKLGQEEAIEISVSGKVFQYPFLRHADLTFTSSLATALAHAILAVVGQSEVTEITLDVRQ